MQNDLVRTGIKAGPYFEEPFALLHSQMGSRYRQSVPPGKVLTLLNTFHAPHDGSWGTQVILRWATQEPSCSLIKRRLHVVLDVDQASYYRYKGSIAGGKTESYSEIFNLKVSDVIYLYVYHDSPYPAEVEYGVYFTRAAL